MIDIRVSAEIAERLELADLCASRQLTAIAVEIGVHRGEFAAAMLHRCPFERYFCVDHYLPYSDMPNDRVLDRALAHSALARYGDRVYWQEIDAIEALSLAEDSSLDFVYIDGCHAHWAVDAEIRLAWTKIRPGGILAGHDYHPELMGVVMAVRAFSQREEKTVYLTNDSNNIPWSWYSYKD